MPSAKRSSFIRWCNRARAANWRVVRRAAVQGELEKFVIAHAYVIAPLPPHRAGRPADVCVTASQYPTVSDAIADGDGTSSFSAPHYSTMNPTEDANTSAQVFITLAVMYLAAPSRVTFTELC